VTVEQASAATEQPGGYPNLVERALACIEAHRGAMPEDALIAQVFGNASSPAMWRPLLRSLLADCPELSLRADGVWVSGSQPADEMAFPDEFVVLDIAAHHRGWHHSRLAAWLAAALGQSRQPGPARARLRSQADRY
jgi:hypothetical protein